MFLDPVRWSHLTRIGGTVVSKDADGLHADGEQSGWKRTFGVPMGWPEGRDEGSGKTIILLRRAVVGVVVSCGPPCR